MATQTRTPGTRTGKLPVRAVTSKATTSPSPDLSSKVKALERKVRALEKQLAELSAASGEPETIVLRTISRDQAKAEIKRLFKTGRVLYYSDIEKELRVDYELVVELCDELMKAEEIMVHADNTVRHR